MKLNGDVAGRVLAREAGVAGLLDRGVAERRVGCEALELARGRLILLVVGFVAVSLAVPAHSSAPQSGCYEKCKLW